MIVRLFSVRLVAAFAALGGIPLQVDNVSGQSKSRGSKIEFSETKNSEMATNLSQFGSKKDRLREFEDDFNRSFKVFATENSMDGAQVPNYRPPTRQRAPNKRAKRLEEQQRDWYLMNPNEVSSTPTEEEMFKLPEYDEHGVEKTEKTPLEKYYDRVDKEAKDRGTAKSKEDALKDARKLAGSMDDSANPEDSDLPGNLGDSMH